MVTFVMTNVMRERGLPCASATRIRLDVELFDADRVGVVGWPLMAP
jgi:hypothetical protein